MKVSARHFLIIAFLGILALLVYRKTKHIVYAEHERFENSLRQIRRLDAVLNQDVLKTRFRLLEDYDAFGQGLSEWDENLLGLGTIPTFVVTDNRPPLRRKVDDIAGLLAEKREVLELFKSQNALLNNSLRYFPTAVDELVRRLATHSDDRELELLFNQLMHQVLIYSLNADEELAPSIGDTLAQIADWREGQPNHPDAALAGTLSIHASTILKRKPAVESLTKRLVSMPVAQKCEELHGLYRAQFATALDQEESSQHILYLLCVVLLAGIGYTVGALSIANRNLERRVTERTSDLSAKNHELQDEVGERRRVEEVLRTKQAQIQALQDSSPLGMFICDVTGACLHVNRMYLDITGYTLADVKGWGWRKTIHPEDVELVGREWLEATGAGSNFDLGFRYQRPDGTVVWASVKAAPVKENGVVTGFVGTVEDITKRKQAEAELEQAHRQLIDTSRQAGMAEVATGVLHNVGNVLNSVNVSVTLVAENLKKSKVGSLGFVTAAFREHAADLGAFLATDSKGKQLPGYLDRLAGYLVSEQAIQIKELESLKKNVEHIKDIVAMQQSFAKVSGVSESVKITDLVEDTLRMNHDTLARDKVRVVREYDPLLPPINVEKHKVLQILVNLVRNAKHACDESGKNEKELTVRVTNGDKHVRIAVIDNGIGIRAENLARIFNHGFTTKKTGHGFGLHSGALAAKEMGGALQVHSEGAGQGAVFTLELPVTNLKPQDAVISS